MPQSAQSVHHPHALIRSSQYVSSAHLQLLWDSSWRNIAAGETPQHKAGGRNRARC